MKKFSKRLLTWLLAAAMVFGLSGITAFAVEKDDISTEPEAVSEIDEAVEVQEDAPVEESKEEPEIPVEAVEVEEPERPALSSSKKIATRSASKEITTLPVEEEIATLSVEDEIATIDEKTLPESDHPYENSMDETWTYTLEGAANGIYVTFDEQTETEEDYDYIYVYDGDNNEIGKYSGTDLAGATLYISTATVKIRLTSDSTATEWGFKVTSVEAVGNTLDLSIAGTVDDPLTAIEPGAEPVVDVRVNGVSLVPGTDFTVTANTNQPAGTTVNVTITGIGNYSGTLLTHVYLYDAAHLQEGASIRPDVYTCLRLTEASSMGELFGESTIPFDNMDDTYRKSITEVTLRPVETDTAGNITGTTTTGSLSYPEAPKTITITAANEDFYVDGDYVHFYRSEEEPVVYVMEGHGRPYMVYGSNVETYPQTQVYEVTVKATGYEDAVGTTTYYTGTARSFSIIIDEDGDESTTDDQWVAKSWSAEELEARATFANGSSQCGMTGFRTFSTMGVSLYELLAEAGVSVYANDYFKINTSDNYGNYKTYTQMFNTPQYYISGIYDPEFAEVYNSSVDRDGDAGYDHDIRLWLGKYAWDRQTLIEPRLVTSYKEFLITGDELEGAVEPNQDNTHFNTLVSFENRFRFVYGIALVQEDCEVTFDTNGGSEVESQTVLSHHMTSTELTTMWQSYWADSLVILRGDGVNHPDTTQPLTGTDTIAVPDDPTKEGYIFAGWYTDENCTAGNEFDFTANDGTVDEDTTIYAKWTTTKELLQEAIENIIDEADKMDPEAYTEASWEDFEAAIENAKAVLDNPDVSEEELEETLETLQEARDNLQPIADKEALKAAIEAAEALNEDDYTPESWAPFATALTNAKNVLDNPTVTQAVVDNVLLELETARNNLEPVQDNGTPSPAATVEKGELQAAVEAAEALNESDYTAESWAALAAALEKARAVLDDPDATQDEVDEALLELQTAQDNLEWAEWDNPYADDYGYGNDDYGSTGYGSGSSGSGSSGSGSSSSGTTGAQTADANVPIVSLFLILFAAAAAAAVGLRRRFVLR